MGWKWKQWGGCINTTREKRNVREDRDRGNKSSEDREFIEYVNWDRENVYRGRYRKNASGKKSMKLKVKRESNKKIMENRAIKR